MSTALIQRQQESSIASCFSLQSLLLHSRRPLFLSFLFHSHQLKSYVIGAIDGWCDISLLRNPMWYGLVHLFTGKLSRDIEWKNSNNYSFDFSMDLYYGDNVFQENRLILWDNVFQKIDLYYVTERVYALNRLAGWASNCFLLKLGNF